MPYDLIDWNPMLIQQILAYVARYVITADEYNEYLNLLIAQGDNNTQAIMDLRNAIPNLIGPIGPQGIPGIQGIQGPDGPKIVSAAFSGNDIVFTLEDNSTVTLANAVPTLTGPEGPEGTISVDAGSVALGVDIAGILFMEWHASGAARKQYRGIYFDGFKSSATITSLGSWTHDAGNARIQASQPASTNYYYEKHSIDYGDPATYADGGWSTTGGGNDVGSKFYSGYNSYYGPDGSGNYTGTGSISGTITEMDPDQTLVCYSVSGSTVTKLTIIKSSAVDDQVDFTEEQMSSVYVPATSDSMGSLIETISAPNGTYPDDGISGGYWWKKTTAAPGDAATLTAILCAFDLYGLRALPTKAYCYIADERLNASVAYQISGDNGTTWQNLYSGLTVDFACPTMQKIRVRATASFTGVPGSYVRVQCFGLALI